MVVVRIPRGSRVLLLEDSPDRVTWFRDRLPNIHHVETVKDAIAALAQNVYDFVFLDHDLGLMDYVGYNANGTGTEAAKHLAAIGFLGHNVFIHSWNPVGVAAMKDALKGAFAVPFGRFDIELF